MEWKKEKTAENKTSDKGNENLKEIKTKKRYWRAFFSNEKKKYEKRKKQKKRKRDLPLLTSCVFG